MLDPARNGDHRLAIGRSRPATLAALAFAAITGCSAKYPAAPDPTLAAVRIHLTSTMLNLLPNNTTTFRAYAIDSDAVYTDVTSQASWSSSDPGVLSTGAIQAAGVVVRAVSAGDANIMVTYGGHTDSVTVRVDRLPQPVPRIEVRSGGGVNSLRIDPLQRSSLRVEVWLFTAGGFQIVTPSATITTSDPNVAMAEGSTIRPVSPGTFRILASHDGLTATTLASVSPAIEAARQ